MNQVKYNFIYLILLRLISRLVPILAIPFLIQKVGILNFGQLQFVKSIAMCFNAIIVYGFNFTIPNYFNSLNIETDKHKIGQLYTSIFSCQMIFSILCLLCCYIISNLCNIDTTLMIYFCGVSIVSGIFPTGIFQGLSKLKYLVILNTLIKILFYILLYIFISRDSNIELYPILLFICDLLRFIIALIFIYVKFEIPFVLPNLSVMIEQIKGGVYGFSSNVYQLFYTQFPSIFLGLFLNKESVTIYKIGDTITQFNKDLLNPFMQSIYPEIHNKLKNNFTHGIIYFKKMMKLSSLFYLIICSGLYIFAEPLVMLLCKDNHEVIELGAVNVFKIHAIIPLLIIISNMIGLQFLTAINKGKIFVNTLTISGIIAIILHLFLVPHYNVYGSVYAILLGEMLTTIVMIIYYYKNNKTLMNKKRCI